MNTTIKEISEQADFQALDIFEAHPDFPKNVPFDYFNDNRNRIFAELIVKECAEQIIAKGTDWVDFAPSQTGVRPEYWDMAQQIKQHFGVE